MNSRNRSSFSENDLRRQLAKTYDDVSITDEQIARIMRPSTAAGVDPPHPPDDHANLRLRPRRMPQILAVAAVVLVVGGAVAVVAVQRQDTATVADAPSTSFSTPGPHATTAAQTPRSTRVSSPRPDASEADAVASAYAKDHGVSVEEAQRILAQRGPLDELVTSANAVIPASRRVGTYIEPNPEPHVVAALTAGDALPALDDLAAKSDGQLDVVYLDTRSADEKQRYVAQHLVEWKRAYPDRIQDVRFDLATSDAILEFRGTSAEANQAELKLSADAPVWLNITVHPTNDPPAETYPANDTTDSTG